MKRTTQDWHRALEEHGPCTPMILAEAIGEPGRMCASACLRLSRRGHAYALLSLKGIQGTIYAAAPRMAQMRPTGERAARMVEGGMTVREASAACGCSTHTTRKYCHALGIEFSHLRQYYEGPKTPRPTAEEVLELFETEDPETLPARYGVKRSTFLDWCVKLGVPWRIHARKKTLVDTLDNRRDELLYYRFVLWEPTSSIAERVGVHHSTANRWYEKHGLVVGPEDRVRQTGLKQGIANGSCFKRRHAAEELDALRESIIDALGIREELEQIRSRYDGTE